MTEKDFPTKNEPPVESPNPEKPEKGDPQDPEEVGDINDPQSPYYDPEKRKDPGNEKPVKVPPKVKFSNHL